jgi:pimeloyl-ACP methyl ester carboxylesterase
MQPTEPNFEFVEYGSKTSRRIVVYFHGTPGSPEECAIFDALGKIYDLKFICIDRYSINIALSGDAYFQHIANQIVTLTKGLTITLIGFSIGAFVALQISRNLSLIEHSLHLISPAAPLDAGDFLPTMAGKRVFMLAKSYPKVLQLIINGQGLLAAHSPGLLFELLFSNAAGADKILKTDLKFKSAIEQNLRYCFIKQPQGYLRELQAYVQPWQASLNQIHAETTLWHGSEDNWSPVAMAEYLASAIPNCKRYELIKDLSHYTCLVHSVAQICQLLV